MQGPLRKVFQAVTYEAIALLFIAPAIAWFYNSDLQYSGVFALLLSAFALVWNAAYNALFEYWEARQRERRRNFMRRAVHAIGFEGGLALLLIPFIAWWLDISLQQALLTDLALLGFFLIYSFVFQYCFDKVFDVPASAKSA
jgi:uncharacterized membrane protein